MVKMNQQPTLRVLAGLIRHAFRVFRHLVDARYLTQEVEVAKKNLAAIEQRADALRDAFEEALLDRSEKRADTSALIRRASEAVQAAEARLAAFHST